MPGHLMIGVVAVATLFGGAGELHAQSAATGRTAERSDAHFSSLAPGYWHLDDAELERLDTLVNIERAFSDVDQLTPYELLGKYADTDAERRRYAERYTQAMAEHQRRSLRWAVSVAEIVRRQEQQIQQSLLRDPVLSGYLGSISGVVPPATTVAARWHLHVPTDCSTCREMTDAAVATLNAELIPGLDVIFIGMQAADEHAVLDWIEGAGFSVEDIRQGRLTVNTDSEAWQQERGGADRPMLLDGSTGLAVSY